MSHSMLVASEEATAGSKMKNKTWFKNEESCMTFFEQGRWSSSVKLFGWLAHRDNIIVYNVNVEKNKDNFKNKKQSKTKDNKSNQIKQIKQMQINKKIKTKLYRLYMQMCHTCHTKCWSYFSLQ